MDCTPTALADAAKCFSCIPRGMVQSVKTDLFCQWASSGNIPPLTGPVIIADGVGGFWMLIVDDSGNVGAQSDSGPQTPDVVLADGFGFFWELIVDPGGLVGSTSVLLPATVPPVLASPNGDHWTIIVDQFGNVGATM